MKNQKAIAVVELGPHTKVGMTESQYKTRSHNIKVDEDQSGFPDGIIGGVTTGRIQFKAGEEFWADEVPKTMASLVETKGEDKEGAGQGSDNGEEVVSVDDLLKNDLVELLASRGIDVPEKMTAPKLKKLAKENGITSIPSDDPIFSE